MIELLALEVVTAIVLVVVIVAAKRTKKKRKNDETFVLLDDGEIQFKSEKPKRKPKLDENDNDFGPGFTTLWK